MAVKTFVSGEILTASDTNTYLANSGLVAITPSSVTNGTLSGAKITVGTAVSSVTVNGVFSSTYDVYQIVFNGIDFSAGNNALFDFDDAATNYNWALMSMIYSSTTITGTRAQTVAAMQIGIGGTNNDTNITLTVRGPNLANRTTISNHQNTDSYTYIGGGNQDATTQHTKFKFSTSAGNMTGGTIMVYGYRM